MKLLLKTKNIYEETVFIDTNEILFMTVKTNPNIKRFYLEITYKYDTIITVDDYKERELVEQDMKTIFKSMT